VAGLAKPDPIGLGAARAFLSDWYTRIDNLD
jgi:hypothetical protein